MTTFIRLLLLATLWAGSLIAVVALLGLGVVSLPETALRALVSIVALVTVVATIVLVQQIVEARTRLGDAVRATAEIRQPLTTKLEHARVHQLRRLL